MPSGVGWDSPSPAADADIDLASTAGASQAGGGDGQPDKKKGKPSLSSSRTSRSPSKRTPATSPRSSSKRKPSPRVGGADKPPITGTRSDGSKTSNKKPTKKKSSSRKSSKYQSDYKKTSTRSSQMSPDSQVPAAPAQKHPSGVPSPSPPKRRSSRASSRSRPDPPAVSSSSPASGNASPRALYRKNVSTSISDDAIEAAVGAMGLCCTDNINIDDSAYASTPQAAKDVTPSPHRTASSSSKKVSNRRTSSRQSSNKQIQSSSRQSSSRQKESRKQRSAAPASTAALASAMSSSAVNPSPRSSSRRSMPNANEVSGAVKTRPATPPPKKVQSSSNISGPAASTAARTSHGGIGAAPREPLSPNDTDVTSEDSWRENGDVEAGGGINGTMSSSFEDEYTAPPPPPAMMIPSSQSSRNVSSNNKWSSKDKNHKKSISFSKETSNSRPSRRRKERREYVECFGWEWKRKHLITTAIFVLVFLIIAGGAVAVLLYFNFFEVGNSKEAFSAYGNEITGAPTTDRGEDFFDNSFFVDDDDRPTPRPTIRPYREPTIQSPTSSPRPTTCTEFSDLFKYFNDDGSMTTTNCLKVELSAEKEEVKCQRLVAFGGGKIVYDVCPLACGLCAFDEDSGSGPETITQTTPRPTRAPVTTSKPTAAMNASPAVFNGHKTFSFFVMGDIPYMFQQDLLLIEQLKDQSDNHNEDEEIFQVHVGDIQNPKKSLCSSTHYRKIAGYFKSHSTLPNIVLPGDNDWNDCPNPDLAWDYWTSNFLGFERNWSDRSDFPSTVMRHKDQPENFAFTRGGVLFLGLNLVGGETNSFVTEADWDRMIDNDIAWAKYHLERLRVGYRNQDPTDESYIRAVIVFGHSPRGRRFNNFLMERLYKSDLPVVYLHGNGHTYEAEQPFISEGWYNYWRVQVDQGFNAPPLKVTVRGTTPDSQRLSMNVNGGKVFPGGFIKLDRRGGLYEGAVATDADGKPLISGSAGR